MPRLHNRITQLSLASIERGLSCNPSPAPHSPPGGKLSITQKCAPTDLPPFIFQALVTLFFIFSPEDATSNGEPPLFPNLPETARNARIEFYDKFQHELDEYDRDFMKKYEDLNTMLIFVSILSGFRAFLTFVRSSASTAPLQRS